MSGVSPSTAGTFQCGFGSAHPSGVRVPAACGVSRKKQRCWAFHIAGIKECHFDEPIDKMKEEEILSSFRERYTAVKRLAITPVEAASNEHGDTTSVATSTGERGVCVMVQFTGPQPSQGPATLLRNLLRGTSVQAQPVELGRGRKKKRTRSDGLPVCVGDGASDAKRLNDDNNKSRLKVKGKFETEKDTTSSATVVAKNVFPLSGIRKGNDVACKFDSCVSRRIAVATPVAKQRHLEATQCGGERMDVCGNNRTTGRASTPPPLPRSPAKTSPTRAMGLVDSHHPSAGKFEASSQLNDTPHASAFIIGTVSPGQGDHGSKPHLVSKSYLDEFLPTPSCPEQVMHGDAFLDAGASLNRCGKDDAYSMQDDNDTGITQSINGEGLPRDTPLFVGLNGEPFDWDAAPTSPVVADLCKDDELFVPVDCPSPSGLSRARGWSFDYTRDNVLKDWSTSSTQSVSDDDDFTRCSAVDTTPADTFSASIVNGLDDSDIFSDTDETISGMTEFGGVPSDNDGDKFSGCAGKACAVSALCGTSDMGAGFSREDSSSMGCCTSKRQVRFGDVTVKPFRKDQECNFEGEPLQERRGCENPVSPALRDDFSPNNRCHLYFDGLERIGHDLQNIEATVHFSVGAKRKVGKQASSIQVGSNGRKYASVFYPSMDELWPEMYCLVNVRVIEVDMVVRLRSLQGHFELVSDQLKVTYRRKPAPVDPDSAVRGCALLPR